MTGFPSRVWPILDNCRPHGIPFDRDLCPPDDEQTDVAAWLAAQWDDLHTTINQFDLDAAAVSGCDGDLPDTGIRTPGDGVGEHHRNDT